MSVSQDENSQIATFVNNRGKLRAIAFSIVGAPDIAEDVLQDAYIRLFKGACPRNIDKPLNYYCQVVRNIAIDYCRKRKVENGYRENKGQEEALADAPATIDLESGARDQQVLQAVCKIMEGLPERTRKVFELHRFSGFTQRQIAEQLGCSAALVNIMIKEAVAAIASCRSLYQ